MVAIYVMWKVGAIPVEIHGHFGPLVLLKLFFWIFKYIVRQAVPVVFFQPSTHASFL